MRLNNTLALIAACMLAANAAADDTREKLQKLAQTELAGAFSSATIIEAVKAQNDRHGSLSHSEIDALDKQWRAEAKDGKGELIDQVLGNDVSKVLKDLKGKGQGLYTEIFVMDNKGLNVGQSDVTSDYWQGDEAKWKKTYGAGVGSVFIDEVEFDESTQTYQSQISLTLVDPGTNAPVGAVTVGVNVDALQ